MPETKFKRNNLSSQWANIVETVHSLDSHFVHNAKAPKNHFRDAKRFQAMFDLRVLKPFKFGIVGNYPCAPNIYILYV